MQNSVVVSLVLFIAVLAQGAVYHVMDNGATGDGSHDDTQAFNKAWELACKDDGSKGTPSVFVPGGKNFSLKPTSFSGPCKSNSIRFEVNGTLIAPDWDNNGWDDRTVKSWINFSNVNNLVITGSGTIDGQGQPWWNRTHRMMGRNQSCAGRPDALFIHKCDGLVLGGLNHVNSPSIHISIDDCRGATLSNFQIGAPGDSPNTDGIDIIYSTNVTIYNASIQTGDDCIAINDNTTQVNISGVACGPGHGISIGSLGCDGEYSIVENVHVQNCSFSGTEFGARIKTCQGGSGNVSNVVFEDITLINAGHPIIIDQYYEADSVVIFEWRESAMEVGSSSNLVVEGVTYSQFSGTCSTDEAITLKCGQPGCSDITVNNVNITASVQGKVLTTSCSNARGKANSTLPEVKCLT